MVDLDWVTSVKRLPATFETNLSEKCLSLVFDQKVANKSRTMLQLVLTAVVWVRQPRM